MMALDSGIVSSFASSRSTGNFPIGQIFLNSPRDVSFARSTICGSNGVAFS